MVIVSLLKKSSLQVWLLLFLVLPLGANPSAPELNCRSAVLYDLETGVLLFEKDSDLIIPPASMTKLMSLHLAYEAVSAGRLTKNQLIPIDAESSFQSSPPRSSLMFLEEGQQVTLIDLMIGLALPSGNDAGVALAKAVAGSMPAFVEMMNTEAQRIGLKKTSFVDSFGYSELNQTTAKEFAQFCMFYLQNHPESIEELHVLTEYTYPREENMIDGETSTHGSITQYNHNNLVGILDGVDGLKTGYIDESGYNLAVTMNREGRSLLAVLMGGPGDNSRQGSLIRAIDATNLLTYGIYGFETFTPALPPLPVQRVYGGTEQSIGLTSAPFPALTLKTLEAGRITFHFEWGPPLRAPFPRETKAGLIICRNSQGEVLFTRELITREGVDEGSLIRRYWDSLILRITRD